MKKEIVNTDNDRQPRKKTHHQPQADQRIDAQTGNLIGEHEIFPDQFHHIRPGYNKNRVNNRSSG